ncbi:diacylglycerol kinase zeta-like isoform X7 [Mytilus trossulus]|uniref:diacylglycerol kinase zeta-like isoform X7 n=1 Tax=Mytilus trossulus TaxID=6551 RepID=UPI003007C8BC
MNIFKRARSGSPSLEVPKICLPRQKRTTSIDEPKDIKCLEVPGLEQRGRSSSFDSASLHKEKDCLAVPKPGRRCQSFDSCNAGGDRSWSTSSDENLSDPGIKERRRKSFKLSRYQKHRPSIEIPKLCVHCVYVEQAYKDSLEEIEKHTHSKFYLGNEADENLFSSSGSFSSSDEDFSDSSYESETDTEETENSEYISEQTKTNGQNAKTEICSNENTFSKSENLYFADDDFIELNPTGNDSSIDNSTEGDYTNALTLQVPVIKQQRSTSFDGCLCKGSTSDKVSNTTRTMVKRQASFDEDSLDSSKQIRSSSVDVNLPTEEESRYKAIQTSPGHAKAISKNTQNHANLLHPSHAEHGYRKRELRSTVDWSEQAINSEHMWVETNASGDYCYAMEPDCMKTGQRKKCVACKIVAHQGCIAVLEKKNLRCKPTFREAGVRNYREENSLTECSNTQTFMRHHWVHRRRQEGKCKQCGKSFQQRFAFQSKEIIAISCSWCKAAYHNKTSCFMMQQIEEQCSLGPHQSIIVPPSWIIKLPKKGSFKSSLRKKRRSSIKKKKAKEEHRPFIIKPIPSPLLKPLLVFINPKSGGNQGAKLLHKFCWWLNPRQVFDLSQGGPRFGLEMYKKVPNLHILACGGDGTVGWILSVIDSLGIHPAPPVAIMPLGTGNDLSRTLNWGGGYTDEPISKILNYVEEGQVVQLDRWDIQSCPYEDGETDSINNSEESLSEKLPLDIFNNYFSLGADAQVALEFHESREANPEKFNSRFWNKMFYAGAGGKDFLKRSCKNIADSLQLICDGKDYTSKVQELKIICLLFLNIPRYSSGTTPWGNPNAIGYDPQRHDDGQMEVIGFTYSSLATLYMGGHGDRICQCSHVKLITKKSIAMQVDGEPCRLKSSVIQVKMKGQGNMIMKPKRRGSMPIANDPELAFFSPPSMPERLRIQVSRISMADYEMLHYDKDKLREAYNMADKVRKEKKAVPLGLIVVDNNADLEQVRQIINKLHQSDSDETFTVNKLSPKWCFLDSTTAERFFRIDRAQEHLHYITDISSEDLYILDPDLQSQRGNTLVSTSSEAFTPSDIVTPSSDKLCCVENNFSKDKDLVFTFSMPVTPPKSPGSPTAIYRPESKENLLMPPPPGADNSYYISESFSTRTRRVHFQDYPCFPLLCSEPGSPVLPPSGKQDQFLSVAHATAVPRNKRMSQEDKALIDASKRGDLPKIVDLFVNQDANLLATDQYGMTALHHAARFGHKSIVKYLIENAQPVILDMVDFEKGQTALHKAAWYQRRTICYMLVEAKASLTKTDYQGNTPRMQALRADDKDLAAYLQSQEHFQLVVSEDQETAV